MNHPIDPEPEISSRLRRSGCPTPDNLFTHTESRQPAMVKKNKNERRTPQNAQHPPASQPVTCCRTPSWGAGGLKEKTRMNPPQAAEPPCIPGCWWVSPRVRLPRRAPFRPVGRPADSAEGMGSMIHTKDRGAGKVSPLPWGESETPRRARMGVWEGKVEDPACSDMS
jgi:hypothetical protein